MAAVVLDRTTTKAAAMKLAATIARSLQADMHAELRELERAVTDRDEGAGRGLKTELRRQTPALGSANGSATAGETSTTRTRARRGEMR